MKNRIIYISIILSGFFAPSLYAQNEVLHYVDSHALYLRWNSVRKSNIEGYNIYRRIAGSSQWQLVSPAPVKPLYAYTELNETLKYKTASYYQLFGLDPDTKKNIAPADLQRLFADDKSFQMLGALSLINPEYAYALGIRFDDLHVQKATSYEYRIVFIENGVEKEWAHTGIINSSDVRPVPIPEDLVASPLNEAVLLKWKKEQELLNKATIVSYAVYASNNLLGPYEKQNYYGLLSISVNNKPSVDESFKLSFLNNGQNYFITVRAVNAFGVESAPAAVVEATPVAPGLRFVSGMNIEASGKQAKLSWNEAVDVEIFRSANSQAFAKIYPPAMAALHPVRQFYDFNVEEGNEYRYYIKVLNSDVTSDTLRWWLPDVTPPSPPKNLRATSKKGVILLNWAPNPEKDILGYEIERASDEGLKTRFLLTGRPISKTSFSDTLDYRSQTTFGYLVYAIDRSFNRSGPSLMEKARMPDHLPPSPPYIHSLSDTNEGIHIKWQSGEEEDIAHYNVYHSRSSRSGFAKIGESRLTLHTALIPDTGRHFIAITAVDSAGNESLRSNVVQVFIENELYRIAPVNGSIEKKGKTVMIRWQAAGKKNPAGFIISRIDQNGKSVDLAQLGGDQKQYIDYYPVKGKITYEIRARNKNWQSGRPLKLQIQID